MKELSTQEIIHLRDSQLNVVASLGVYAAVWGLLQVLLRLFDVDMPIAQLFDRYGNFSLPGILVAFFLLLSAFVPHWVLLRQKRVTWREASQLIRQLKEQPVPSEDDPEWAHFLEGRPDDDVESRD
ncbi:MAG: hypothetical protein Q4G46_03495 [Propionibacteriaceae bacterium]|nr:hypothetical protein [Propionibacteriaceae bacterium]